VTSFDRILVPFDGTPRARDALELALETYPDAEVTALHVIDYLEESYGAQALVGSTALRARARERSAEILSRADSIAEDYDTTVVTESRVGKPAREIVDYAEAHDADVIVIGSHGRPLLSRVLLGSVAETVVRRAPTPVMVVR
jgi:nucleotide-binding universal stress UspA family protein